MGFAKVFLVLLTLVTVSFSVYAVTINGQSGVSDDVSIKLGEFKQKSYTVNVAQNETVSVVVPSTGIDGVMIAPSQTYFTQSGTVIIYFFANNDGETGEEDVVMFFDSSLGNKANITFELDVNTLSYDLFEDFLSINEVLQVGSQFRVKLMGANPDVSYKVFGCGYEQNIIVPKNVRRTFDCGTTKIHVTPEEMYAFGNNVAVKFLVNGNENLMTSTFINETDEEDSGCELSLNTVSQAQRGRIFGIETVDANSGKPVKDVSVIITDIGGGADVMQSVSDRTGYVSFYVPEEAVGNLIIRLSKDGCEPFNRQIEFGVSYETYQAQVLKNRLSTKLNVNLTMSSVYEDDSLSGSVITGSGERVQGAEVRAMSSSGKVFGSTTDGSGRFKFDSLNEVGDWVLQAKKDGYELSDEVSISVLDKKSLSIVQLIEGKLVSSGVVGQDIQFKLVDDRGNNLPVDASIRFGNQNIPVTNGLSSIVELNEEGVLSATVQGLDGYKSNSVSVTVKPNYTTYYIGGVVAIVLFFLIINWLKKRKGKPAVYSAGNVFDSQEIPIAEA